MNQILTPAGYRKIADCQVGDLVVSAQSRTGRRVLNAIESIQRVDADEWQRWHNWQETPDFVSYRINDDFTLFGEQSIMHNGGQVTHAKHLRPGNRIFFRGRPVTVKRVRKIDGAPWHRLDIDGDHTYIGDGMAMHNASRFWVGGTGTWDLSDTSHWSATDGGSSGASAPGSADTATLNANSGGGTVTPSYGGTGTFQSITCGAFGGTIDWSANDNNVTLSASTAFNASGSGTRTINLGDGTWTLTTTVGTTPWSLATTTNLTFSANSSTINLSGACTAFAAFAGGGLTYNALTLGAIGATGGRTLSQANTFATLTVTGQNCVALGSNQTITTLNLNGTSSAQVGFLTTATGTQRTATVTNLSAAWAFIRDIAFSGSGLSASNSFDGGNNTNVTITAPSTSGGAWPPIGVSATFVRTA